MTEVQTRSDEGELRYFDTIAEAMAYAESEPLVWKVSFAVGDERVRLVRNGHGQFVYEPLLAEGFTQRRPPLRTLPPLERGSLRWRLMQFTDYELEVEMRDREAQRDA